MTDNEQVDLVSRVLRAALASLASEHIASGLVVEGCGNCMAEVLARISLAHGGTPAVIDQRLVLVTEEILRVAHTWVVESAGQGECPSTCSGVLAMMESKEELCRRTNAPTYTKR